MDHSLSSTTPTQTISNAELNCRDLNYKEQLKKVENYLELMYKCGYSEKEYASYYDAGNLSKVLINEFNGQDVAIVYSYIEEKFGPTRELNLKK